MLSRRSTIWANSPDTHRKIFGEERISICHKLTSFLVRYSNFEPKKIIKDTEENFYLELSIFSESSVIIVIFVANFYSP